MADGLRDNDPYRNMDREDIHPDFLDGAKSGALGPSGSEAEREASGARANSHKERAARSEEAANDLRQGEESAAEGNKDETGKPNDLAGVRQGEEGATGTSGLFTGKGIDKTKKRRGKGKFRKAGPITGLLISVFSIVAMIAGLQPFQLFSFLENAGLNFDRNSTVLSLRVNRILKQLLTSNDIPDRNDTFGKDRYKIPDSLVESLKKHGIEIKDEGDFRFLVYTDSDGKKIPIVGSESDFDRVPSSIDGVKLSAERFTFDGAKSGLRGFRTSFNAATITMTGRSAGWFDSLTTAFLKRIGGDDARSKLSKLGDNASEEDVREVILKNVGGRSDSTEVKAKAPTGGGGEDGESSEYYEVAVDERLKDVGDENDSMAVGNGSKKIENSMKATAGKFAATSANPICAAIRAMGAINVTVSAIQVANTINYTLKILEAIDKTKAGDGDNSFNIIANLLNTPFTTTAYKGNGEEITLEGATTSSNGFNAIFSDKNIVSTNDNDSGALMANREFATRIALGKTDFTLLGNLMEFGSSTEAFKVCMGIQIAAGAVDFVSDVVLFVTTAGVGNFVKKFIAGIVENIGAFAVAQAMGVAISVMAPMAGKWLSESLPDVFLGKVAGYVLNSGVSLIYGGNLQMSAGVNANEQQTLELYGLMKEAEKEWAEYDRMTLSPFDISSKYTFLGSLAYSLVPILNKVSASPVSLVSSSFGLVGDSVIALTGQTVSAASETNSFKLSLYHEDECPSLYSMGVAGDAYCNAYHGAYTDDLDTLSSVEIYEKIKGSFDGVDGDGVPKIKSDSDYAKYIVACMTNDVQPGTMSGVVQGVIDGAYSALGGDTVAGRTLIEIGSGFIPFSGAADIFDAKEQMENIKWNNQEVCSDPEYRYYSDYSVDQRALENIGIVPESAVSVFLDEYYEKNPLDNSREGIIARYSGLSKDEVIDTLALIEYVDYIANYDPSERYAFGAEGIEVEVDEKPMFDNENQLSGYGILIENIVYADVRNRNYAV